MQPLPPLSLLTLDLSNVEEKPGRKKEATASLVKAIPPLFPRFPSLMTSPSVARYVRVRVELRFAHHGWHSLRFQINGKQLTFMHRHAISAVNWRKFFLPSFDLLERTPKKINPMGVRGREPDCLEFLLNKFALSKAEIAFPWQTLLLGQFCPKLSPHAIFLIMTRRVKLELMVPSRKAISNLSLECALCFQVTAEFFLNIAGGHISHWFGTGVALVP